MFSRHIGPLSRHLRTEPRLLGSIRTLPPADPTRRFPQIAPCRKPRLPLTLPLRNTQSAA
jgi:hypothetical protein